MIFTYIMYNTFTTPGSKERGVFGVGNISVGLLPFCQDMKTVALYLHKHGYSWVVKIKKTPQT